MEHKSAACVVSILFGTVITFVEQMSQSVETGILINAKEESKSEIRRVQKIYRIYTCLALNDYDWMNYNLSTKFLTDEYGELKIVFNYFGLIESSMYVTKTNGDIVEQFVFVYSTDIFQKYITIFLTHHIAAWDTTEFAFYGESYVLDFYNEVIQLGELTPHN